MQNLRKVTINKRPSELSISSPKKDPQRHQWAEWGRGSEKAMVVPGCRGPWCCRETLASLPQTLRSLGHREQREWERPKQLYESKQSETHDQNLDFYPMNANLGLLALAGPATGGSSPFVSPCFPGSQRGGLTVSSLSGQNVGPEVGWVKRSLGSVPPQTVWEPTQKLMKEPQGGKKVPETQVNKSLRKSIWKSAVGRRKQAFFQGPAGATGEPKKAGRRKFQSQFCR